ncbi:hypothetical protein GBF38_011023 [Nibea albiflora]|uniref:Uncharacterized protein n=1 Tax=Nibea albiflora TaxID=240163 RepID=A0ACB7ETE3_NIBAL|nr:hypothetical protein GBF38_011023 [Nibea albiflora]
MVVYSDGHDVVLRGGVMWSLTGEEREADNLVELQQPLLSLCALACPNEGKDPKRQTPLPPTPAAEE